MKLKLKLNHHIKTSEVPFLIAGPCSAESEEQVFDTVSLVKKHTHASLIRAGIWKPRTRPDSFEGIGAKGLPWLVNAGKAVGLPVATEVANAKHVENALNAGVDVLWIGARTSVNPFTVQEIADALNGVEVPVMIKNPVNPDFWLWVGAFERLLKAGVNDLTAIHRGFSIYNHAKYRNIPNWEIPIRLKEELPNVPIICDPSHISGKRNGLQEVAQKALDLNFDGLMIESHVTPDQAWSDKNQQITPEKLGELLKGLTVRKPHFSEEELTFIELMREKIAKVDDELFLLLSKRMILSQEIGSYKKENEITILQHEHWKQIIASRLKQSKDLNLTAVFIRELMDAIHQESIRQQTKVMYQNGK